MVSSLFEVLLRVRRGLAAVSAAEVSAVFFARQVRVAVVLAALFLAGALRAAFLAAFSHGELTNLSL